MTDPEFDPERLLTTLSGDIAILRTRIADLSSVVEQVLRAETDRQDADARLDALTEQIRQIAALQEKAAAGGSQVGPVWNWAAMTAPQASKAWQELVGWIDVVLLPRNPQLYNDHGKRAWAPCWYLHPDAVDELSALYGVWKLAFTGSTRGAMKVAEWRDRWLPGTRNRLHEILRSCAGGEVHRPAEPPRPDQTHDLNALQAYVQQDLQRRPSE